MSFSKSSASPCAASSKCKSINDIKLHVESYMPEIRGAINRVLARSHFILGLEVSNFESAFADYHGTTRCVALANGTDALELALKALKVGPGDVVATVANAGMYGSAAIMNTGAVPTYIEVDASTLLMDSVALEHTLSLRKVDAIIVTHLYGRMADMEPIMQVARRLRIPVIEDCAQAHGACQGGKKAGSFGEAGCFSFYPSKNLGALGDAGAVITNSDALCQRIQQYRQYGWSAKYHAVLEGGRNSRMDELQAAILNDFLPCLDDWNGRRRRIAESYDAGIHHPGVVPMPRLGDGDVAHLYIVRSRRREALTQWLADAGIATDVHYPVPDYLQPALASLAWTTPLTATERACEEVLTLPCYPEMTQAQVSSVIARINSWPG